MEHVGDYSGGRVGERLPKRAIAQWARLHADELQALLPIVQRIPSASTLLRTMRQIDGVLLDRLVTTYTANLSITTSHDGCIVTRHGEVLQGQAHALKISTILLAAYCQAADRGSPLPPSRTHWIGEGQTMIEPAFYKTAEVESRLNLSYQTIYRLAHKGILVLFGRGKGALFSAKSVDALVDWMEQGGDKASAILIDSSKQPASRPRSGCATPASAPRKARRSSPAI